MDCPAAFPRAVIVGPGNWDDDHNEVGASCAPRWRIDARSVPFPLVMVLGRVSGAVLAACVWAEDELDELANQPMAEDSDDLENQRTEMGDDI
jgi:hypothetical protein